MASFKLSHAKVISETVITNNAKTAVGFWGICPTTVLDFIVFLDVSLFVWLLWIYRCRMQAEWSRQGDTRRAPCATSVGRS